MRSAKYELAVRSLMKCNIVTRLAVDLPPGFLGYNSWHFISKADAEYVKRDGNLKRHIGAVAEAIGRLNPAWPVE